MTWVNAVPAGLVGTLVLITLALFLRLRSTRRAVRVRAHARVRGRR